MVIYFAGSKRQWTNSRNIWTWSPTDASAVIIPPPNEGYVRPTRSTPVRTGVSCATPNRATPHSTTPTR